MSQLYVPHDLSSMPEVLVSEPHTSSKLPSRPQRRVEKWDAAKFAVLADKDNWRKWDAFFKVLEDTWTNSTSKDGAQAAYEATKAAFSVFLTRFPYSAQHWRQFSLLQYKMGGLEQSLLCLKDAVAAYPQSVSLWVEYLTALTTVEVPVLDGAKVVKSVQDSGSESSLKNEKDESSSDSGENSENSGVTEESKNAKKADKNSAIRLEFMRAADAIGANFNSDPFWNKYIEFETTTAEKTPSPALLNVYLRLIRIPLYQYAQYYNQFMEINKSFAVTEIVPEDQLPKYLEVFGKSTPTDLSVVEQNQVIDTFSYDVFTQTQLHVTKKWPFEAALTFQEFSIPDAKAINAQTEEWVKYLDAEIETLASTSDLQKSLQIDLIVSLFERALVPNYNNATLWKKYVDFLDNHSTSPQGSFEKINAVYQKAIFTFLPLNQTQIRESYVQFLSNAKDFDAANEFLLKAICLYSGITGSRIHVKDSYIHELQQILTLWAVSVSAQQFVLALENLVTTYFNRVDRYKKENTPKSDAKETPEPETTLRPSYITSVAKYLNDDGICVVAVHLLRFLEKQPESADRIRKFYNKNHTEQAFSRSVQFWRFFVDFEGYGHKNLTNLRSIVTYVKTATALPKMAIDVFLDIYYELTCTNLAQAISLSGKENYLDILVNIDAEKSDDLYVNKGARARLARNNYLISDNKLGHGQTKEDALMRMRAKHVSHPGVFVDAKPEITNRLMDGEWISLLDDDVEPPVLPTFRNLDKANASINYPDE